MTCLKNQGVAVSGVEDDSTGTMVVGAEESEILHLHWTYPYLIAPSLFQSVRKSFYFFKSLISLKARGKKLVWTIHNLGEHEKRHPRFELLCHRLLARIADGIIVHSRYARNCVIRDYKLTGRDNKVFVIGHGNYIDNYVNEITRDEARQQLGIDNDKSVFLFLGQIRPYKGLPELISAFKRTVQTQKVLVLAGKPLDSIIKDKITAAIGDRKDILVYPEFVQDAQIQVFMNAADIVVFPFRDIFTSGSILLAMSFGKAILIPDLDSLEEIKQCHGAVTYDPEDHDGLLNAINLATSVDLPQLGARNFQEAKKHSWDAIAHKTMKVYEACYNT